MTTINNSTERRDVALKCKQFGIAEPQLVLTASSEDFETLRQLSEEMNLPPMADLLPEELVEFERLLDGRS